MLIIIIVITNIKHTKKIFLRLLKVHVLLKNDNIS